MSELSWNEQLLAGIVIYGASIFGLALGLAALGVPFPSTLLVLGVGALIRQGDLDWRWLLAFGALGVIAGDLIGYAAGRMLGEVAIRRRIPPALWAQAEQAFTRYGGRAIFWSRCVLTPLAVPVNLMAGSSHYPIGRFILYDALGEMLWLTGFGVLGYVVGTQWELVAELVSNSVGLLVGVALVIAGYFLYRRWGKA